MFAEIQESLLWPTILFMLLTYFIQSNCELVIQTPENCTTGNPLTWNLGGLAVKTYQIKGDSSGSNTFNLNTWQSGTGGTWYNWYVTNGNFSEQLGTAINCSPLATDDFNSNSEIVIYPNPTKDKLTIRANDLTLNINKIYLYNQVGQKLPLHITQVGNEIHIDLNNIQKGIYLIIIEGKQGEKYLNKIIRN